MCCSLGRVTNLDLSAQQAAVLKAQGEFFTYSLTLSLFSIKH